MWPAHSFEVVGDRATQSVTLFNMSAVYSKQGNLAEAERLLAQVVVLAEAIQSPHLTRFREILAQVRAKRAAQAGGAGNEF